MSVLGWGYETMGDEVLGEYYGYDSNGYSTVGVAPQLMSPQQFARNPVRPPVLRPPPGQGGAVIQLPQKPGWRPQLAPGVPMPGQGLEPLPLRPQQNGGLFTPAVPTIDFEARPQAPFRAERLIATVRRSAGAGAVNILSNGIFIGRYLQQLELGQMDIEIFRADSFGVRLALAPAEPGVLIRIQCVGSIAVPANESVAVTLTFLGHSIR